MRYKAKLVKGRGIGRTIGFPTFNFVLLNTPEEKFGVYICAIFYNNQRYLSIANWGEKPTLNDCTILLEIHVLDEEIPTITSGEIVQIQFMQCGSTSES